MEERIGRLGPRPWSELVAVANDAFYGGTGGAGRGGGDFVTSPEVGPLFGAVVARAVDGWWRETGSPDVVVVVEAGAGPGTLARSVLAARPACAPALRWVLVERSAAQRARHGDHLSLDESAAALPPVPADDTPDPAPVPAPDGPIVVSLAALPSPARPCLVLANELLDDLPFDLWEARAGRWGEVRIGLDGTGALEEVLVAAEPPSWLPPADELPDGARVPVQTAARGWLRDGIALARPEQGGRVLTLDYSSTTPELARRPWPDWVRTYAAHGRAGHPLAAVGTANITCEVAVDQLSRVRAPDRDVAQRDWLAGHGLGALVAEAEAVDPARVVAGDLAAIRLRSRLTEAAALTDPAGLGAFRVLEWGA